MKPTFALASFAIALGGLAALATPAKAGDFSLRINVGVPPPPVVIAPDCDRGPVYRHDRGPDCRDDRAPRGYWKEITLKVWVPARWSVSCDRHGREVRVYERGHYEFRKDRVWVEYGRGHDRDRYARR